MRDKRFLIVILGALVLANLLVFMMTQVLARLNQANTMVKNTTKFSGSFSHTALLKHSWDYYKKSFIQADGRVIDQSVGAITTSEGQSYAMLRAVWMNDRETFDRVYRWSIDNLQAPRKDKLFAWKWGRQEKAPGIPGDSWGPIDLTAASDADEDIALALFMAATRWQAERYHSDAMAMLNDLWEKETMATPIGRVLLPGDWKRNGAEKEITLNPSYFSPHSYRIFAALDARHPWLQLVESSYKVLNANIQQTHTHLPSDWLRLSLKDGKILLFPETPEAAHRSDYGYDAIRAHWRIAMDQLLTPQDSRSTKWLAHSTGWLASYWKQLHKLPGPLTPAGQERAVLLSNAIFGATMPSFLLEQPAVAQEILTQWMPDKIGSEGIWTPKEDYYAQNWIWFGVAAVEFHRAHRDRSIPARSGKKQPVSLQRLTSFIEIK